MALEKQLQVGDGLYDFRFPTARGGGDPGFVNNGVFDARMKVRRLTETRSKRFFFSKPKVKVTVSHHEVEFRWLPWVSGKINYAQMEGRDVLSGMFTGCWMTLYKQDGAMRVGHVATQNDAGDCKEVWRRHRSAPGVVDVKEFRPDLGMQGEFNLGLATATGTLWKIQLAPDATISVANPWTTVEEWMDPEKGDTPDREMADFLSRQTEILAVSLYGGQSYRIDKIEGPVPPETFPTG